MSKIPKYYTNDNPDFKMALKIHTFNLFHYGTEYIFYIKMYLIHD